MITGQRGKTGWDMSKWPKGGVGIKGKWKVAWNFTKKSHKLSQDLQAQNIRPPIFTSSKGPVHGFMILGKKQQHTAGYKISSLVLSLFYTRIAELVYSPLGLCGPYNAFVIKKVKARKFCAGAVPSHLIRCRFSVKKYLSKWESDVLIGVIAGPYHGPQRAGHCPKALYCGPQGCAGTDHPHAAGEPLKTCSICSPFLPPSGYHWRGSNRCSIWQATPYS